MNKRQMLLRQEYSARTADLRALVDVVGEGTPTTEQEAKFQTIKMELSRIDAALQREQALVDDEIKRGLSDQVRVVVPAPFTLEPGYQDPSKTNGPARSYSGLFGAPPMPGYADHDFLSRVGSGLYDPSLIRASQNSATPSQGGFLVPESLSATWLGDMLEKSIVMPRAQTWGMTTPTRKIPAWDDSDHSGGGVFGGLEAHWIPEEGDLPIKEGKIRLISLTAHKLGIVVPVSNELLADGLGFDQQLSQALPLSMMNSADEAFLTGTGAGRPLGVLNAPSLITVNPEAGQAAGTILWENVIALWARMHPACCANAVWLANPSILPQLCAMQAKVRDDSGDVVGGGAIMVQNAVGDAPTSLFGRPIITTEKLPALGTKGDLLLVDLSQYAVGLRKEVTIDRSAHAGFTKDQEHFRAIMRLDGQGTWAKAFTPKHGPTLSWAVALANRT